MSLKAGRVGVAPDQVDEFGKIKSEATSGYTKQEADDKFETKSAASAALAEKQSIRLSVPLELLSGSALTVEDALHGLNDGDGSFTALSESAFTNIISGAEVEGTNNHLVKYGKVVYARLNLQKITATAWTDIIAQIPEGYRPKYGMQSLVYLEGVGNILMSVTTTGTLTTAQNLSNNMIRLSLNWITE